MVDVDSGCDQMNTQTTRQKTIVRPELIDSPDEPQNQSRQMQVNRKVCSQHRATKATEVPETHLTAMDHKKAGNKLCSLYRYDEALVCYTKAIAMNPEVAIFFSNKALCHLKLQQWFLAIQDCRRALELDPNLIKAHFFLGQALAETNNYDDALKHLQRAHELARENKVNFGDDIAYQIRLIKRHRWNKIEEETTQLEDELQSYLVDLIKKDMDKKLKGLEDSISAIQIDDACRSSIPMQPSTSSPQHSSSPVLSELKTQEQDIKTKCDSYIDKLETMFNNLKLQRRKRDVPDYLCGKISFEIMHDPVVTPSGITYDRQDIEEHLERVGHFDPVTRQPLEASQLISNLAMKEVVDAYLNENEWALYY